MKTKIRAIITKLRGIEDDLIDLLSEPEVAIEKTETRTSDIDSDMNDLLDLLDGSYNGEPQLKDSFHELSEALEKANGISLSEVGKHIHYGAEPTPH